MFCQSSKSELMPVKDESVYIPLLVQEFLALENCEYILATPGKQDESVSVC